MPAFRPVVTKRQRKRQRDTDYKRKMKKRVDAHNTRRLYPVIPADINGEYIEADDEGFVRYKRSYNYRGAKYLRKLANRKVRRTKDIPPRGGYRKCFDYWWILY